jgi:hypothetical protein
LVREKVAVNLNNIYARLRHDNEDWTWPRSFLYRAMYRIGFKFSTKRCSYYDRLGGYLSELEVKMVGYQTLSECGKVPSYLRTTIQK